VSGLMSQGASRAARELLDEAVSRLHGGFTTAEQQRGTELRIEAARGYLWLAQVEAAELVTGRRAALEALALREVQRGLVPGGPLEPEPGDAP